MENNTQNSFSHKILTDKHIEEFWRIYDELHAADKENTYLVMEDALNLANTFRDICFEKDGEDSTQKTLSDLMNLSIYVMVFRLAHLRNHPDPETVRIEIQNYLPALLNFSYTLTLLKENKELGELAQHLQFENEQLKLQPKIKSVLTRLQ